MKRVVLRAVALAVIGLLIIAPIVHAFTYSANIQVQETGGESHDYLPVIADVDNDYLADNGYISITGLDTQVLSGSIPLKHLVADDKVLFVAPSVGAKSTGNYKYTLGNALQDDFPIIVGYSTGANGYITIADDAIDDSLELGDDFEIEQKGRVDTSAGSGKNLVYKSNAFRVYIQDTGKIRATIFASETDVTLRPNGDDEISITNVVDSTHWGATSDNSELTYVYNKSTSYQRDLYTCANLSYDNMTINSVTISFKIKSSYTGVTTSATPHFKINGEVHTGEVETQGTSWGTKSQVYNTSPATEVAWTVAEINAMQIGVSLKSNNATYESQCADIWIEVDYSDAENKVATVTGVSSGELIVKTTAGGNTMTLSVTDYGGNPKGNNPGPVDITGVGVPPNTNDWYLNQNNVMSYMDYYMHTVGGDLIAWYQPVSMIIDDNLDDRAGDDIGEETGNGVEEDATIVWGANPDGVTPTVGSLVSSSQPSIAPASEEETADIVPEGYIPSGGTVDTVALQDNPLYPIVKLASEHTDLTEEQIWFGGATLVILIAMGLAVKYVPNHLLLAGVIGLVFSGFFLRMGIYQWWMMLVFGPVFLASLIFERKPVL